MYMNYEVQELKNNFTNIILDTQKEFYILKKKEALLSIIADICPDFLRSDTSNGGKIQNLLKRIGKTLEVDRGWYSPIEKDKDQNYIITFPKNPDFVWYKSKKEKNFINYFSSIPNNNIAIIDFINRIKNGDIIYGDINQLENKIRNKLLFLKTKSYISCPILNNKKLIGVFTFSTINEYRKWKQEEIDCLILVSNMLGAWIEKLNNLEILKESENKFKILFEQLCEAVYLHDKKGKIIEVNKSAIKDSGFSYNELTNMTIFNINPNLKNMNDLYKIWENLEIFQYKFLKSTYINKSGIIYPVNIKIGKVLINHKEYILSVVQNINKFKELLKMGN